MPQRELPFCVIWLVPFFRISHKKIVTSGSVIRFRYLFFLKVGKLSRWWSDGFNVLSTGSPDLLTLSLHFIYISDLSFLFPEGAVKLNFGLWRAGHPYSAKPWGVCPASLAVSSFTFWFSSLMRQTDCSSWWVTSVMLKQFFVLPAFPSWASSAPSGSCWFWENRLPWAYFPADEYVRLSRRCLNQDRN